MLAEHESDVFGMSCDRRDPADALVLGGRPTGVRVPDADHRRRMHSRRL
jgi:hypothetical protein